MSTHTQTLRGHQGGKCLHLLMEKSICHQKKNKNKRGEHNHRHEPSEHNTRQFNSIAKIDGVGDGNYPN